jgi:hypothetical protein
MYDFGSGAKRMMASGPAKGADVGGGDHRMDVFARLWYS